MIRHLELGDTLYRRSKQLMVLLNQGQITFAGNRKLKIFGTLKCSSGKRMKLDNRVFFEDETEALQLDYRPCGHCMREAYRQWKALNRRA